MRFQNIMLVLLLLVPAAYSAIEIEGIEGAYNLGEQIRPLVEVSTGSSTEGFLQAEINCKLYSAVYYVTPITVDEVPLEVEIFPLMVFEDMLDWCELKVTLKDIRLTVLEEKTTSRFDISDELDVELVYGNISLDPGDTLEIKGSLFNARGEAIDGDVTAVMNTESNEFEVVNSSISISLDIPSDIESGENKLLLTFDDGKGNSVDRLLNLDIVAKPTRIRVLLNDDIYLPHEELIIDAALLDQAGDEMDGELGLKIMKADEEVILANSSGQLQYLLDNSLEPGTYAVVVSYGDITEEVYFEIADLVQLVSAVDGQKVIITNNGNVDYKNTSEVVLSDEENNITIKKKVKLKPKESVEIDMSAEVAEGTYAINLPSGEVVENVSLEDNRNVLKKAVSGIASITGSFAKEVRYSPVRSMIVLSLFLLIVIAIALIQYFHIPVMPKIKKGLKAAYKKFSESTKLPSVHVVKKPVAKKKIVVAKKKPEGPPKLDAHLKKKH
jgi:hypothetical protein